jgi:hypothetical protein
MNLKILLKCKLPENYTGVFSKMDIESSFELILKNYNPQPKKFIWLSVHSDSEIKLLNKSLRCNIEKFKKNIKIEILNKQIIIGNIGNNLKKVEKNSAILLYSFFQDISK